MTTLISLVSSSIRDRKEGIVLVKSLLVIEANVSLFTFILSGTLGLVLYDLYVDCKLLSGNCGDCKLLRGNCGECKLLRGKFCCWLFWLELKLSIGLLLNFLWLKLFLILYSYLWFILVIWFSSPSLLI